MNFFQELQETDFGDLFDRLVAYASWRLKSVEIRVLDGKEPCDLVGDLLEKVVKGIRNPETATSKLDEFLFGCLKSDIDAFFNRKKIRLVAVPEDASATSAITETAKQTLTSKDHFIVQLRSIGADEEEIKVFNIWTEGITRPAEVGTELGLPSSDIYRIQRRLFRRLEQLRKNSNAFA